MWDCSEVGRKSSIVRKGSVHSRKPPSQKIAELQNKLNLNSNMFMFGNHMAPKALTINRRGFKNVDAKERSRPSGVGAAALQKTLSTPVQAQRILNSPRGTVLLWCSPILGESLTHCELRLVWLNRLGTCQYGRIQSTRAYEYGETKLRTKEKETSQESICSWRCCRLV